MIQPLVTGYAVTYVLDYVDRVLLQRWAFEAGGPTKIFDVDNEENGSTTKKETRLPTSPTSSFWARLVFGFDAATSRRHLNTPYEVKNCRHFSAKDKSYVPSRSKFILGALGSFVACYLFIDINDANAQSDQDSSLFAPDKIPFFSRLADVAPDELAVRFIIPLVIWATSYSMIQMTYDLMSIVAVGLHITNVNSWRPVFGSIWDAYTVRKFWGNFWHQQLRDLLNDPATIITHRILHLPANGLAQRYTKIVIAFFISGVAHMFVDLATGLTYLESGSVRFFTTQALGIMIEDAVQGIWKRSFGGNTADSPTAKWKRVVGFIWLWSFMAWSVPSWMYAPILSRTAGEQGPLMGPLSVSRWFLGKK
ncbi:hypothetical protein CONLIGDRAFT_214849 [Coniochaeta ligniaria NRRL 30616]|uniref:Wax synthase domain-containing protein n=1 Tax=Coniochaeta ligniaria NRRL 30616 TaxID=1408157 RepID=A0A1J7I594_9PEZI|nr:hypothetical protein CONLIGDRAFT_214849 [Coniochaeta ligniaria NRRL 30616]